MKKILFKALRNDYFGWIRGQDTFFLGQPAIFSYTHNEIHMIDVKTRCQYLNFEDKNGQTVFSNDIIRIHNLDGSYNSAIIWNSKRCIYEFEDKTIELDAINYMSYEIVGNIFELSKYYNVLTAEYDEQKVKTHLRIKEHLNAL